MNACCLPGSNPQLWDRQGFFFKAILLEPSLSPNLLWSFDSPHSSTPTPLHPFTGWAPAVSEAAGTPFSCKVGGIWKGSLDCACGQHKGNSRLLGDRCALESCQEQVEDLGYGLVFLIKKVVLWESGNLFLAPWGSNFSISIFRYPTNHPSTHPSLTLA